MREWVRRKPDAAWDPVALAALAVQCSATEQNATDAEREGVKVKALRHLEGRLGEATSGIITGLVPSGCFIELEDTPVEGFLRPSQWIEDQFMLDSTGVRLVGRRTRRRFTLGDSIQIVVARVDVPARECDFALIETSRRGRGRRHARRN